MLNLCYTNLSKFASATAISLTGFFIFLQENTFYQREHILSKSTHRLCNRYLPYWFFYFFTREHILSKRTHSIKERTFYNKRTHSVCMSKLASRSHHHTYYVTSSYILCHIIIHTHSVCMSKLASATAPSGAGFFCYAYVCALYVCLICVPYMCALCASVAHMCMP